MGMGEGGANPPHEGIAPEEGLYDVRIPPEPTIPFRFGFRKSLLAVALDTIAAKMDAPFAPWTPKIIVIPWATCRAGFDLDGISNAINTMTNMKNVLVVTSMGNCSTCLGVAGSVTGDLNRSKKAPSSWVESSCWSRARRFF